MKAVFLGSVIVALCAGIILGYGWKGVELRSVSHWGIDCSEGKPIYRGPTGDNHSVEVYRLAPYIWLDGRRLWQ